MSWLSQVLCVGAGGFVGASLRFVVTGLIQRVDPLGTFPYGTVSVNVIGCFLIGALGGLADARHFMSPGVRLVVVVGVLGGFTTFSSFAYETLVLAKEGAGLRAGANVVASVVLCLIAVWAGYGIGNR